ncbi:hypothetical protein TorRG33x02_034560 [Trema orientale]|uniref:Uncharacterized protein n=1 Tax=Trema orientale TaxID=63057 RepID=A0A2P5FSQ1_TREOI|nr:hypothetical protein TorRG33x02_034560 [Trema orientale]
MVETFCKNSLFSSSTAAQVRSSMPELRRRSELVRNRSPVANPKSTDLRRDASALLVSFLHATIAQNPVSCSGDLGLAASRVVVAVTVAG